MKRMVEKILSQFGTGDRNLVGMARMEGVIFRYDARNLHGNLLSETSKRKKM